MAANFSRVRESRRSSTTSGVRRGFAAVALTAGISGFAALGMAGLVSNPASAAPGNNGTVKVSGDDLSVQPNNEPHLPCNFNIQWYNFDEGDRSASVSFAAQAPTSDTTYTISGNTSPTFTATGGADLNDTEGYTLSPVGDAQPQQGYHVKITVTTDKANGQSETKAKTYWIGPCDVPTTPATTPATTPPTTPPTTETTTPATTPATTIATGTPTGGSPTIPESTGPGNPESVYTPTATESNTPQPGKVVPTRIESGLVTLPTVPTSATTQQQRTERWPLLALSGLSALLGAIGLLPRRRTSRRS